jgi:hypothetical protein
MGNILLVYNGINVRLILYLKEILQDVRISIRSAFITNTLYNVHTHEFAIDPKYLARPETLIDNDPKASTTSGFCSSSLEVWVGEVRDPEGSLCNGALMRSKSSVRSG